MELSAHAWSERMFGDSNLGDKRRTRRLVDVAGRLASHIGQSMAACCRSSASAVLGGYRFIENKKIVAEDISDSAFAVVAAEAAHTDVILAVEDTTTMLYSHSVSGELGTTGRSPQPRQRGYMVHSVLLVDAQKERTMGLIEQRYWHRVDDDYGKKHDRARRAYEDKESYKWQRASQQMHARLGEATGRTISVCDREADIYEYLKYKEEQGHRYVVRARCDRPLEGLRQTLFKHMADECPWVCEASVTVAQRGGRPARTAQVQVSAKRLTVRAPRSGGKLAVPLELNVVVVRERSEGGQASLNWVLLTTEPIDTEPQIKNIIRYYKLRWRIEEYHKAWKSGVGAERLRMQHSDCLLRMLVVTAFVAVRLLQLREHLYQPKPETDKEISCDSILERDEWVVLWMWHNKNKPPATVPSLTWAARTIAKMGGFTDSKRTGKPGWMTMWKGWEILQERVAGFRAARQFGGYVI